MLLKEKQQNNIWFTVLVSNTVFISDVGAEKNSYDDGIVG